MKSLFKFLIPTMILVCASFAWAGGDKAGNGGDAVVCRASGGEVQSIELLDFYEARVERGETLSLSASKSLDENMEVLFERLGFHDTFFRDRLKSWYQTFDEESLFLSGVELVDIPDSNHLSFPVGCKVEQVAVQRKPQFPGEKFYKFNKDLWDRMDSANQAGLILHELMFRNLTLYAQKAYDSTFIRYLSSTIAGNYLSGVSYFDYVQILSKQLEIPYTNQNGYLVPIKSVSFDENKALVSYQYELPSGGVISISGEFSIELAPGGKLHFRLSSNDEVVATPIGLKNGGLVYRGVSFFPTDNEPKVRLSRSLENQRVLGIDSKVFYEMEYPLAPESLKTVTCEKVEFDLIDRSLIHCASASLSFSIFGDIPKSYYPVPQKLQKLAYSVSNLKIVSASTDFANISFSHGGFVNSVQCQKPGEIDGLPATDFIKGVSTEEDKKYFFPPNAYILKCEFEGDEIQFSSDGRVISGGRSVLELNLLAENYPGGTYSAIIRTYFYFGKIRDFSCAGPVAVTAPRFEVYPNGQVVRALVDKTTYYQFGGEAPGLKLETVQGKKIRVLKGDIIRFNDQGKIEEIEDNVCRYR